MTITYQQAVDYLNNLQMHKIKLGLEAMNSFLARIGQPEKKLKIVHVAGTNGKGSVSASLLNILQLGGYRVGLYTSPHLSSVRERFRINDQFISEEEFAATAERIMEVLGEDTITYFEFTTALAFLWFAESDLDLVILETGLGGRLDATNVSSPLMSIITSISMDHEAYLGNSLTEVAGEKAGIIKPQTPVVAANGPEEVIDVLSKKADVEKAPLYLLGRDFDYGGKSNEDWSWQGINLWPENRFDSLKCSMRGAYQRENGSLAIAALALLNQAGLEVSKRHIHQGLGSVRWPGRLEYLVIDKETREWLENKEQGEVSRFLLDGAHNPEGIKNLSQTLAEEYRYNRLIIVWGAMIDKDIASGLASILPLADTLLLTTPDGERSAEPEQLLAHLPEKERQKAILARDVAEAITIAEKEATSEDLIVVAGSLYLVGAVRKLLVGELVD